MLAAPRSPLVEIRPARPEDAVGIGAAHVRSWQGAYRGLVPQPFLDGLEPARRAAGWASYLEAGPRERESLLVARHDGTVVGFANVGPSRDDSAGEDGELRAIYLLPDYWGQGLGRALMGAAVAGLVEAGFREAVLWVLEANTRARRFYEAGGWQLDGGSKEDQSLGFPLREVRYRRALP